MAQDLYSTFHINDEYIDDDLLMYQDENLEQKSLEHGRDLLSVFAVFLQDEQQIKTSELFEVLCDVQEIDPSQQIFDHWSSFSQIFGLHLCCHEQDDPVVQSLVDWICELDTKWSKFSGYSFDPGIKSFNGSNQTSSSQSEDSSGLGHLVSKTSSETKTVNPTHSFGVEDPAIWQRQLQETREELAYVHPSAFIVRRNLGLITYTTQTSSSKLENSAFQQSLSPTTTALTSSSEL